MNDIFKDNLSFLAEDRLEKTYILMSEGFYLGIAIVLSNFNIESKKIKLLRKSRKEELMLNVQDLIGQDKLDAINSFAINKWEYGGDKKLSNKYYKDLYKIRSKEERKNVKTDERR